MAYLTDDREYQDIIKKRRNEILHKFDLGFCQGQTIDKENIPIDQLDHFIKLDRELQGGIITIYGLPGFDGYKNYVILFDENSPLTEKIFQHPKKISSVIGIYEIKSGKFRKVKEDEEKIFVDLMSNKKYNGPSIFYRLKINGNNVSYMEKDNKKWFNKLYKKDWASLLQSKNGEEVLVSVNSSSEKSSQDLVSIMNKLKKSRKISFLDFMVLPYYGIHEQYSIRNNQRSAWQFGSYIGYKLKDSDDKESYIVNPEQETLPKLGIAKNLQFSNVLRYHKNLDPVEYHKHVGKMRIKSLGFQSEGSQSLKSGGGYLHDRERHRGCMAYYCGVTPDEFFEVNDVDSYSPYMIAGSPKSNKYCEFSTECTKLFVIPDGKFVINTYEQKPGSRFPATAFYIDIDKNEDDEMETEEKVEMKDKRTRTRIGKSVMSKTPSLHLPSSPTNFEKKKDESEKIMKIEKRNFFIPKIHISGKKAKGKLEIGRKEEPKKNSEVDILIEQLIAKGVPKEKIVGLNLIGSKISKGKVDKDSKKVLEMDITPYKKNLVSMENSENLPTCYNRILGYENPIESKVYKHHLLCVS